MRRLILSLVALVGATLVVAQPVKFGVITDLHQDIIHDAPWRLATFLDAAEESGVDFIIDLGDFAMVKDENKPLIDQWNNFDGDAYHVLGNHDMDNCTKDEYMAFVGMAKPYYSFDRGDFHFIVLDANFLNDGGEYIPYSHGNFYVDGSKREWIDPEQVEWLKEDLRATDRHCIIFSHQSLENSVGNRSEIQAILEAENSRVGYTKVVAALSGHDHIDYAETINGIVYVQINSASDCWLGEKHLCESRYDKATYERRPALKYVAPYKDPLFAIVAIKGNKISIKGVQSEFVPPVPDLSDYNISGHAQTATISDYKIKFK